MTRSLGGLVRATMDARGIKGYDLAARLGKQPSYVSRLINDEIKETLPVADMEALERELGLPQRTLLRAAGYRLDDDVPEPFPPDSERAALAALVSTLDEQEAGVVRELAQILIRKRDARTVSAAEAYAVSGSLPRPAAVPLSG